MTGGSPYRAVRAVDGWRQVACHPNAASYGAPSAARLAARPSPRELPNAQVVQSIIERNRTMARTKRSRRSCRAGEWGPEPDPVFDVQPNWVRCVLKARRRPQPVNSG